MFRKRAGFAQFTNATGDKLSIYVFSYEVLAEPAPNFTRENSISFPHPTHTSHCPCTLTSPFTFLLLLLQMADPDTLLLSPAHGSDGSRLPVDRSSPSWTCRVCWAHCPLQLTPSLTGITQLSHAGLAVPIGIAIYDLCSKCNIEPQFCPQNSLIMWLCIAYVLVIDPKVSHAKNEPEPWRTESARGPQTCIPELLYVKRRCYISTT